MRRSHGLAAVYRSLQTPGDFPVTTVETIRSERILIVIDDAHTGLTLEGAWRSVDFADFVEALTTLGGAARIVMASERALPLPESVPQVPLPLLSQSEAELLARELAEYHAATDTEPRIAGAWKVCRGHPGLVVTLSRSREADDEIKRLAARWGVFSPPSPRTLASQKPLMQNRIGADIENWTLARMAEQPAGSATALVMLCALEAPDRHLARVAAMWPLIASQLDIEVPGSTTDSLLDGTMAMLDEAIAVGLIQISAMGGLYVHPAAAAAARTLRPDVDDLTARLMAMSWQDQHDKAVDSRAGLDALAHYAASAVPYLIRQGEWEAASMRAEQAIHHDMSPSMAARLIPFVNEIVIATTDSPLRAATRFVRATIVGELDPGKGLAAMTELYEEAEKAQNIKLMVGCMTAIANHTAISNPAQALRFVQQAIERVVAGVGPLASIMLRLNAAKLCSELGDSAEISARRAREISADLDAYVVSGRDLSGAHLPTLRAELLQFATQINVSLDREPADGVVAGLAPDPQRVPQRNLIRAQFNAYVAARHRAGSDSFEEVFAAMLAEYGEMEPERALVLGELAEIRWESGNSADALELLRRALRIDYATTATSQAARDHRHRAAILAATGDSRRAAVHLLAAGIIHLRISAGLFAFVGNESLSASVWTFQRLMPICALSWSLTWTWTSTNF
jgi:tetratricopeptide (TPR) repeat protein